MANTEDKNYTEDFFETTTEPDATDNFLDFGDSGKIDSVESPVPSLDTNFEQNAEVTIEPSQMPIDVNQNVGGHPWLWLTLIILFVLLSAAIAFVGFLHVRKYGFGKSKKHVKKQQKRVASVHDGATEPVDDPYDMDPAMRAAGRTTEQVSDDDMARADRFMPRYSVGVAQTIGKRSNQEDSFACSNPAVADEHGLLAVVADGVGGLNNGQVASSIVVRDMCSGFEKQSPNRDMSSRLLDLAAMAQSDVLKVNRQGEKCGSTLVSVLIQNDAMVLLSIGDSRIALYRAGVLMPLNREHVLAKDIDENMALGYTSQADNRKRTAITAYVGKENLKYIDRTITPMQVITGDRILLMSDGVFGTVSDEVIIDALRYDVDTAAKRIISAVDARNLPHQDNATIVIVGVN